MGALKETKRNWFQSHLNMSLIIWKEFSETIQPNLCSFVQEYVREDTLQTCAFLTQNKGSGKSGDDHFDVPRQNISSFRIAELITSIKQAMLFDFLQNTFVHLVDCDIEHSHYELELRSLTA